MTCMDVCFVVVVVVVVCMWCVCLFVVVVVIVVLVCITNDNSFIHTRCIRFLRFISFFRWLVDGMAGWLADGVHYVFFYIAFRWFSFFIDFPLSAVRPEVILCV